MRTVFISLKSLLDKHSGAALEVKSVLEGLAADGMECSAISFNCYDTGDDYAEDERIDPRLSPKNSHGEFFHYDENGIRHYLYVGRSKDTMKIDQEDMNGLIRRASITLNEIKPDVVVFFGSNDLIPLLSLAKTNGAKILFYTGTASYDEGRKPLFDIADSLVVPTTFIGSLYKERFGKDFRVIPTTLPFGVSPPSPELLHARRMLGSLTLVNPTPDKGAHFLMRAARSAELKNRSFLFVESRGTRSFWKKAGVDISANENVHWAPWQTDISQILSKSAVLLMPSLIGEAAGKVIAEAMALGVPCVGFDIGGIKEQIGQGGMALPFDNRLAAHSETRLYEPQVPGELVQPWVDALDALLSDEARYTELSHRAVQEARRFLPENTVSQWGNEMQHLVA